MKIAKAKKPGKMITKRKVVFKRNPTTYVKSTEQDESVKRARNVAVRTSKKK